ncbi:hypothetical protein GURASL_16260 [Geotalea uraniireducens]|uniref:Uncharacterized protein n=1 Tax=Geotalea uraniireducens TaxID=351604 RepID=A0ABN6VQX7_9BACT|nr:hypothetical protein GURASL_16260 [Geotalea uraniireducens]
MGRVWSEYAFLFNQKTGQLAEIGDTAGIFLADCLLDPHIFQDVEQIPREIVRETNGKIGVPDMRRFMIDIAMGKRFGMGA